MPKIELGCGKTTCAKEKGKFCRMMRTESFGRVFRCGAFGKELQDQHGMLSGTGWLQRLPECIKETSRKPRAKPKKNPTTSGLGGGWEKAIRQIHHGPRR